MSFAEKLRTLRHQYNMTQADVANRLSVARSTIAGYEKKNRQPSQENLTALSNLFHVSVDYLINDEYVTLDSSQRIFISDEEQELYARYRGLSSDSKKLLMDFLHILEKAEYNIQKRQNL